MKASPLQIPGKSIRPPDSSVGLKCPHCGRKFLIPRKVTDHTGKVKLVCPHCGRNLF